MILLSNSTLSLSDAEEGMRGASVPLATVKGAVKGGKTKCGEGQMKVERVERIGNKGVERC